MPSERWMHRPDWVTHAAWVLLEPVLARAPVARAADALGDLEHVSAGWDTPSRDALIARFADRATSGAPLPAALVLALTDLLGADHD